MAGKWDKYVGHPYYPRDLSVTNGVTYIARKQAVPSLISFQDGHFQIHDQNVAGQYNATSGLRFLVRGGVITDDILYDTGPEHTERHARAIECLDGKGRYMRLNVDGVWPDQGITLLEAARIVTEPQFGAREAFDTGGGGDVTDVVGGIVQNVPQDGAQRRIPEFVCLFEKENTMPTVNVIQGATSEITSVFETPKGTIIGKLPACTPIEGDRTSGTLYNDAWIHIYAPITGWVNKSSVPNWHWVAIPTGGSASASVSRSASRSASPSASRSVSASPSPSPSAPPLEPYTVIATLDDDRGFYGEATITMYPK